MLKSFSLLLFLAITLASPAIADNLVGRASVVDADTVEVGGQRIRLHAIDAPESSQLCRTRTGDDYRCGQVAALALADFIGARNVSCAQTDIDRYQRIVAVCDVQGTDINAWLVENGHALAYRQYGRDYVDHEDRARMAGRGIWAGEFVPPWDWRRGAKLAEARTTSTGSVQLVNSGANRSDCRIKGNISKNGRIYHVPGSRYYDRTRIDTSRGERWFCSVEEAVRAGWRAPRG
ncbi:MAG TPA: thermonuclease family protein [Saliniramus sp.]|nr:thermonuclease family protein [Saliniramus sp.]